MPPSIHVFSTHEASLPFRTDTFNALFLVETETMPLDRAALCEEIYRILRMDGLVFVQEKTWRDEFQNQGFVFVSAPKAIDPSRLNWRAAYISGRNSRLQITELEKQPSAPFCFPFFTTALCAAKKEEISAQSVAE